jgi:hypothetical protein
VSVMTKACHDNPASEFDRSCLDLGYLVGRKVTIFSEQYPGQPLSARVVQATDDRVELERISGNRLLDNLVSNQAIVMQFIYKQEEVATSALFKRTGGGRTTVMVGQNAKPLKRRRFARVNSCRPINLAVLPVGSFRIHKLPYLRWLQTNLVDFSSGGALFDTSSVLHDSTYLLVNVELESYDFPPLLIGSVRHCLSLDAGHCHVGIEFIITEQRNKHFPGALSSNIPRSAFEYSYLHRKSLNSHITAWMHKNPQNSNQGNFE